MSKHDDIVTTDLSRFGYRERKMAAQLLTASVEQGFPDDFDDDGVTVMMNGHSGNVFLTNAEYQVAMMNGDKLESWYSCPYCGHEGFKEDMAHDPRNAECTRYLQEIGVLDDEPSEDEEPTEPSEDDLTTEDHQNFYQNGRKVLKYHEDGTANYLPSSAPDWRLLGTFDTVEQAVRAYMDKVQFWPNYWFISDHGNAHLVDLNEHK